MAKVFAPVCRFISFSYYSAHFLAEKLLNYLHLFRIIYQMPFLYRVTMPPLCVNKCQSRYWNRHMLKLLEYSIILNLLEREEVGHQPGCDHFSCLLWQMFRNSFTFYFCILISSIQFEVKYTFYRLDSKTLYNLCESMNWEVTCFIFFFCSSVFWSSTRCSSLCCSLSRQWSLVCVAAAGNGTGSVS